ncbi:virulence RhuM family protein [Methylotenera sp.]|uniref:virulence RhuM family protein n=1 Tax=Methylotenera sp. TaxID=2051956 RepID=UPI002487E308|nr:virulence RhuM family protein [Methylotenera sp.]MDI1297842.1 virulence RhuM family protein [Methylotenera sp.]
MSNKSEMIIYQNDDGRIRLETRLQNETLWMTQSQIAELFGCSADNVSLHLKNIFEENELIEAATSEEFSVVRLEGERQVSRNIKHYNLDAIISVGYRVKSVIATRFRIWATQQLKEFIIKGFVMDDVRLKNPPVAGSAIPDYFAEMLARVRDIRASERRMYLRVREIFALAADYAPTLAETTKFFSVIQNKLHFAATGMTAAELISSRVDHAKPNMGLNTWLKDEVRKTDVMIAKNYLAEKEVTELNRIVTMWLDFAEDQARRRKQVFMQDWADKLDDFLRFNDRAVLNNAGSVSKKQAEAKASLEYEQFDETRRALKETAAEKDYLSQLIDVIKLNDKK